MDFPRFFIVDFPLKFLENIVIVDFPFSFYSGFSFIVDFHGTRQYICYLDSFYIFFEFFIEHLKLNALIINIGKTIVISN